MARDIGEWLDGLGLARYATAFADNEIDLPALPHITEEDLKQIGVALGARRKLSAAIAELGESDEPAIAGGRSDERSAGADAERRQLTVMFVDLVGSTALAERLDPEDLREVIRAYQESCAEAVARFEGHIAKYIGDGLLVYFGYPQAHEDDPRRAVMTGLGIVAGLETLNRRLGAGHGVELSVRVGIHTGLVVVGEMGGGETRETDAIVGSTPNIAARLEGLAEPNTVVISAATQRLVKGLFECDDLGPQELKGVSKPVRVFRVRGESAAHSRFEATVERGLTPLVGREEEIDLLLKRWAQARDGEGQVVLLSGEAGVGKSRLLRELRARMEGERHSHILWFGSPYHQHSAFHVTVDQLRRAFRFEPGDTPLQQLAKLEAVLTELGISAADHAPVLAALLALPIEGRYPPLELSPAQFKQKAFASNTSLIRSMAVQQPVLMAVEDAHWIDPSTLELLSHVIERLSESPVLFIVTFRPEFEPTWEGPDNAVSLELGRLSRKEAAGLAISVAGGAALPRTVVDQIVGRADGVPLFVEELTKAVIDTGVIETTPKGFKTGGALRHEAIPETLQDLLTARLDRLAPVKEIAQLAATIGRTFSRELLAAALPLGETELDRALDQLVEAELLQPRSAPTAITYEFNHALVRDAAYQSLLNKRRRQFHKTIAEVLEQEFPAIAEAEPEVLAQHYTEAGVASRAIEHWSRAGKRAVEQSANLEAVSHLTKALDLIASASEPDSYSEIELEICLSLGPALMMTKGIASADGEQAYSRARKLSRKLGDDRALFAATWGLWYLFEQRNRTELSHDLALEAIDVANRLAEPEFLIEANHSAWTTTYNRGKIEECFDYCEDSISRYHPEKHRQLAFRYAGHDPHVCALVHSALTNWTLGYPDLAQTQCIRAHEAARDFGHIPTEILAKFGNAIFRVYLREPQAVRDAAQDLAAACEKLGAAQYVALANLMEGWGRVYSGEGAEAVADMYDGLANFEATGAKLRRSLYLTHLADALLRLGDAEQGLERISDAIEFLEEYGEYGWAAYSFQVRGDLLALVNGGDSSAAEDSLDQAIAIARGQKAKAFELRATTSLARLWHQQGKTEDARNRLAVIYDWFTEGYDTPDLKAAKALLNELSEPTGV